MGRIPWLEGALCLAVLGCATSIDATPGTARAADAGWLSACDADAECPQDGICACGVCTRACQARSDCADMQDAECNATIADLTCGGMGADIDAICIGTCGDDSDCEGDALCHEEGYCVRTHDDPYAITIEDGLAVIGDRYRACDTHRDCTLVSASCGCCDQDAIASSLEFTFDDQFALACSEASTAFCNCAPADLVPVCRHKQCSAVPRADVESECYSPFQNLGIAHDAFALGCPCDNPLAQICLEGTALACDEAPAGVLVWHAIVDGPCWPRDTVCGGGGEMFVDARACLAARPDCYQLDSGEFCGFRVNFD